ncbi:MAG: patatin-like phospholipase family protein [Planctomycetota bacterium]|jgi:predicted acylesterase/phospholipase RssA
MQTARLFLSVLLLAGCAPSIKRNPVPEEYAWDAVVPGLEHVRIIGLDVDHSAAVVTRRQKEFREQAARSDIYKKPLRLLAISGGGANGAFGAGLLCGWTEAGDRPEFAYVTGVSTGALIAPFAFLGQEYDDTLREVYTTLKTDDLIEKRGLLTAIGSDAFADTDGLKEMIAAHIDEELLEAIAREHRRGRRLYVGTTNLDLMQPVMWSISHIADSGDPKALQLVRDLLLASASIPGAFPPVYFEVEAAGERYDEMHVDGGAAAQVFLYPLSYDMEAELKEAGVNTEDMRGYVIRNSRLKPHWEEVEPKVFSIVGRSVSALIRSQGVGDLYQIYLGALRDKIDFNLAYIPDDFDLTPREAFDPEYMQALFDVGFEMARSGYPWEKQPPDFELPE